MKLKRNVVMLPTNERAHEVGQLMLQDNRHLFKLVNLIRPTSLIIDYFQPQHLYITSDEKPIDGDWVIPNDLEYANRPWKFKQAPCPMPYWGCCDNCKKIIAITDKSLGLPSPSDGFIKKFIEKYNAGNPITEVMVEYEYESGYQTIDPILEMNPILKIDKNNCITITSIKETWTREEVISLCRDCFENSCKYSTFNEWIEQNL